MRSGGYSGNVTRRISTRTHTHTCTQTHTHARAHTEPDCDVREVEEVEEARVFDGLSLVEVALGGRPRGHPIGRSVGNGRWAGGVPTIQTHGCATGVRKLVFVIVERLLSARSRPLSRFLFLSRSPGDAQVYPRGPTTFSCRRL